MVKQNLISLTPFHWDRRVVSRTLYICHSMDSHSFACAHWMCASAWLLSLVDKRYAATLTKQWNCHVIATRHLPISLSVWRRFPLNHRDTIHKFCIQVAVRFTKTYDVHAYGWCVLRMKIDLNSKNSINIRKMWWKFKKNTELWHLT